MLPEQLSALNKLILICTASKKIRFHAYYLREGTTVGYLRSHESLADSLIELLHLCDIPASKRTQSNQLGDVKPDHCFVIIPNLEALTPKLLNDALLMVSKRQAITAFLPETLQSTASLLSGFSPIKLVKSGQLNRTESSILAAMQTHDCFLALKAAESQLFPLFKSKQFEAMLAQDVVKLLKQIHKLAYRTVAETRGASSELNTVPDEFKQAIALLLTRLGRCSGQPTEIIKHAAFAYQSMRKLSKYSRFNDLLGILLLNAVLQAYGYPTIQLCNSAERRDEASLYRKAVKHIDQTLFYLEQQIDYKLALELQSPSKPLNFTDKQKACIEAATHTKCRRVKPDGRVEFSRAKRSYHLGLLVTKLHHMANTMPPQLTCSAVQATFISPKHEKHRYSAKSDNFIKSTNNLPMC